MEDKDKVSVIIGPSEQMTVLGTGAGNMRLFAPGAMAPIKTPVSKEPDAQGPHGRAWTCNLDAGRALLEIPPGRDATLVHWIVEAPWAHPIWHSYSIALIHLRPVSIDQPTFFAFEGATHELWVFALDPDADRERLIETGIPAGVWLQPRNFGAQFIEVSDDLAMERIKGVVQKICDGSLSPDTDWLRDWVALFNDKMVKPEFR